MLSAAIRKVRMFKSELEELKSTIESITPTIEEIERLNQVLGLPGQETAKLKEVLIKGAELVSKSSKVKCFNFNRFNYADRLIKLNQSIERLCKIDMQTQLIRDNKKILVEMEKIRKKIDRDGGVFNQVELIEGVNTVFNRVEFDGPCLVPDPPEITPGLDAPLKELRTELVKDEGMQVIVVSAPGGAGKTTLVKKLCADNEIKDKFRENIFCVTVSKTPDVMAIIRRIFQNKKCEAPTFQTEEEAINYLE
ncbi:hypothetical protein LWI28_013107 [Acer negundo]|uniref:RPW8 domain-containing protein n=1 Tax=Acer negundo TaxID=4023 RepID=A0AAD5IJL3_ACENE|nr:hypothetical protein LWI28_013107 [Acer negundo]